jgi:hypothetical protein
LLGNGPIVPLWRQSCFTAVESPPLQMDVSSERQTAMSAVLLFSASTWLGEHDEGVH